MTCAAGGRTLSLSLSLSLSLTLTLALTLTLTLTLTLALTLILALALTRWADATAATHFSATSLVPRANASLIAVQARGGLGAGLGLLAHR